MTETWEYDHEDEWRYMIEDTEYTMGIRYDEHNRALVAKQILDALMRNAGAYKYEEELKDK